MPNVSFETKVRSVDLTIQINDISEETANRIKRFITEEMLRPDPFADFLVAERDAAKVEPLPEIKEDPVTEEKPNAAPTLLTAKQKRIRGMAAYVSTMQILKHAKAHPLEYEWSWTTAKDFCDVWDAHGFHDPRSVGVCLSGLADEGVLRKRGRDGTHPDRTYYLPFPVLTEEQKTTEIPEETQPPVVTVGDRIREYRTKGDLSIADLSTMIGYPESAIKAWEDGTSAPSVEGKKELESLFGKSIFNGVQKPVIW